MLENQPKNLQVNAYRDIKALKLHEVEMQHIIKKYYPVFTDTILDIGCGPGTFIEGCSNQYPSASFIALDINPDMIETARERLKGKNVEFILHDILAFQPERHFSFIHASGILSVFDDIESVLTTWLSWLVPSGYLFIFGGFNSKNIDTVIRYRNNFTHGDWESGLTSYSLVTVGNILKKIGASFEFIPFHLSTDLPESDDPIRSYTRRCSDGSFIVMNGANIVREQFFLIIRK